MIKEELEKEAEEYRKEKLEERKDKFVFELPEVYVADIKRAYLAGAEPREKRIKELIALINAERGRQEKCDDVHLRKIAELEKENADLKCECRRCVYTDCPCVLSDYEKDRNGICDHFKDVLDENAELKEALEGYKKIAKWCDKCDKIAELKSENQKWKDGIALKDEEIGCIETEFNTFKSEAKEIIERLLITSCNSDVLNLLPNCSEVLRVRVEAEQFLNSEVEK